MKRLERKRSELGKKKRVQSKTNRTEEQALRYNQAIITFLKFIAIYFIFDSKVDMFTVSS